MNYYLIIHDVASFLQHPDWIGRKAKSVPADFQSLRRNDGIVYYCKEDHVITGTFRVTSSPRIVPDDEDWPGPHVIVQIKTVAKARPPYYVPIKQMLQDLAKPLSIFPKGKLEGIKLRGRTFVPLTKADFDAITKYVRSHKPPKDLPFRGPSNDAGLGAPRDFGVMNYAPTSEQGVVALFVGHMKELGFEKLEFVRQGFPDACAIEKSGTSYARKFIEFEYRSSGFRQHVSNPKHRDIRCDYVVCWEHDYLTCPVKVIELKTEMDRILGYGKEPETTPAEVPPKWRPKKPRRKTTVKKVRTGGPRKAKTSLADLLEQGKLKAGQEIRLNWRNRRFEAKVEADGGIFFDDQRYGTLSAAGKVARNGLSTNGWAWWRHFDGQSWVPLADLRE